MKKTLIAVAALAATGAFAQNVTVTGTVDATYRSSTINYANGTSGGQTAIGQNGSGTSNFTLIGSEDLGGGLKAIFNTEFDFDAAGRTAGPVGGGQLFVGVEGAFGSIKLGDPNSPTLTVQAGRSFFGTKDGGRTGVAGTNGTGTANSSSGADTMGLSVTRTPGSLLYTSPSFSGFSVQLAYAPSAKADATASPAITDAGAVTDIGGFYANGPIVAGVTQYKVAAVGTGADKTLTSYYGSYNFNVVKLTLGGHKYANGTLADNNGYGVAVDVPLSPALTLAVHLQKVTDNLVAAQNMTVNAVGVNYALSKRTSAYARYVSQTNDNSTVSSANEYLFGLRHNF